MQNLNSFGECGVDCQARSLFGFVILQRCVSSLRLVTYLHVSPRLLFGCGPGKTVFLLGVCQLAELAAQRLADLRRSPSMSAFLPPSRRRPRAGPVAQAPAQTQPAQRSDRDVRSAAP